MTLDLSGNNAAAPGAIAPGILTAILDEVTALMETGPSLSVTAVFTAFGAAASLPLVMLLALIIVSPLSGIFFLPSIIGLTIALIALQVAFGRGHLWLPGWICRRSISRKRLEPAVTWLRRPASFLDHHCRPRLLFLTHAPLPRLWALVITAIAISMPFLELIPSSSSLFALAITLIAFTLLTRDGIWALMGLIPMAGASSIIAAIWL